VNRPQFSMFQIVTYLLHEHHENTPCVTVSLSANPETGRREVRACQREGYVTMITHWRRGDEYGYLVTDQFGKRNWLCENEMIPVVDHEKRPVFNRKSQYLATQRAYAHTTFVVETTRSGRFKSDKPNVEKVRAAHV